MYYEMSSPTKDKELRVNTESLLHTQEAEKNMIFLMLDVHHLTILTFFSAADDFYFYSWKLGQVTFLSEKKNATVIKKS